MGNGISETGTLTIVQLVLIAAFAILVVIGMLYGARLKGRRKEADRIEGDRIEAEGAPPEAPQSGTPPADAPSPSPREESRAEPSPLADEPVPAAAPLDASPATIAADAASPASTEAPADGPVTQLKGLGPKVAARLAELGVTTVGQVAALDAGEAEALDAQLGTFRGRMARDRWIEQARFLAAGDIAGFEAVFGRL